LLLVYLHSYFFNFILPVTITPPLTFIPWVIDFIPSDYLPEFIINIFSSSDVTYNLDNDIENQINQAFLLFFITNVNIYNKLFFTFIKKLSLFIKTFVKINYKHIIIALLPLSVSEEIMDILGDGNPFDIEEIAISIDPQILAELTEETIKVSLDNSIIKNDPNIKIMSPRNTIEISSDPIKSWLKNTEQQIANGPGFNVSYEFGKALRVFENNNHSSFIVENGTKASCFFIFGFNIKKILSLFKKFITKILSSYKGILFSAILLTITNNVDTNIDDERTPTQSNFIDDERTPTNVNPTFNPIEDKTPTNADFIRDDSPETTLVNKELSASQMINSLRNQVADLGRIINSRDASKNATNRLQDLLNEWPNSEPDTSSIYPKSSSSSLNSNSTSSDSQVSIDDKKGYWYYLNEDGKKTCTHYNTLEELEQRFKEQYSSSDSSYTASISSVDSFEDRKIKPFNKIKNMLGKIFKSSVLLIIPCLSLNNIRLWIYNYVHTFTLRLSLKYTFISIFIVLFPTLAKFTWVIESSLMFIYNKYGFKNTIKLIVLLIFTIFFVKWNLHYLENIPLQGNNEFIELSLFPIFFVNNKYTSMKYLKWVILPIIIAYTIYLFIYTFNLVLTGNDLSLIHSLNLLDSVLSMFETPPFEDNCNITLYDNIVNSIYKINLNITPFLVINYNFNWHKITYYFKKYKVHMFICSNLISLIIGYFILPNISQFFTNFDSIEDVNYTNPSEDNNYLSKENSLNKTTEVEANTNKQEINDNNNSNISKSLWILGGLVIISVIIIGGIYYYNLSCQLTESTNELTALQSELINVFNHTAIDTNNMINNFNRINNRNIVKITNFAETVANLQQDNLNLNTTIHNLVLKNNGLLKTITDLKNDNQILLQTWDYYRDELLNELLNFTPLFKYIQSNIFVMNMFLKPKLIKQSSRTLNQTK
jgi:hypothetical protein